MILKTRALKRAAVVPAISSRIAGELDYWDQVRGGTAAFFLFLLYFFVCEYCDFTETLSVISSVFVCIFVC